VSCWGDNAKQQLGRPSASPSSSAVPLVVEGIGAAVAVAVLGTASCALLGDGSARCWGDNGAGQLGRAADVLPGSAAAVEAPVGEIGQLDAGQDFVCARTRAGLVRCWGGWRGRAQSQPDAAQLYAAAFEVEASLLVSAGQRHTCAILRGGAVSCWGDHPDGRLVGLFPPGVPPGPVEGLASDVVQVSAGNGYSCAVTRDGAAWCWGSRNAAGQLGDGTTTPSARPVRVVGLSDVAATAAGSDHTCAVSAVGRLFCWGATTRGRLGPRGSDVGPSPVPVEVDVPCGGEDP
jgi:alpha-tubulin suppressor-like RCC1 family protein